MPTGLLFLIITILFIALSSGVIAYFHRQLSKKQKESENQIKGLQQELAAASARLSGESAKLKTVHEGSDYQKYAGLILPKIDLGVIVIDHNGVVRVINEYAQKFLDLSAAVGVPYKDAVHIRTGLTDDYTPFETALTGKALTLHGNMQLVSQRGTFPISGTITPLSAGTAVEAVVFIFEDNSKQVERVREEQAFFSAAAHELRTPLTIIRMTVSLLLEKFDSLPKEKIIEHLRRTDETTEKLVKLVNDFLSISRIDQGRLEIKMEKFDMLTLTDEVIGSLNVLAKQKNLYIHHELEVNERMVLADRAKTAEVLTNLIGNGLKYTIQGGLTITHAATATAFTTTVTDTGTGIQKDSQGLLFKRFGQAGRARGLVPTKSTGLGLYISKKLAELMRGDVSLVRSDPGTGSTFAFTLPLR